MPSMKEREIVKAVDEKLEKSDGSFVSKARDFIVRRNAANKWEVEFTYIHTPGYSVKLKGGKIRVFPRLNGIQKWLEKIGVREFKVII